MKKERDYLEDKLQEVTMEYEKMGQELMEVRTEAKQYKEEYFTFRDNYEASQKYVVSLESEISQLKQKIKRLNEIAEQFMQNTESVDSAFSVAAKGSMKAINELNHNGNYLLIDI